MNGLRRTQGASSPLELPFPPAAASPAAAAPHRYLGPVLQPVKAADRHHFVRLDAVNGLRIAIGHTGLMVAELRRVVGLHHVDECALGVALNGGRGYQRGIVLRLNQQARVHELVRKQRRSVFGKMALSFTVPVVGSI